MLYLYAGNRRLTFARSILPFCLRNPFLGCRMPPISYIKSALRKSGVKSSQQSTLNHHSVFRLTVNSQQSTANSQQSTVNSQQSTITDGATGIDITAKTSSMLVSSQGFSPRPRIPKLCLFVRHLPNAKTLFLLPSNCATQ